MTDIPNGATRTARATIAIALIGLFGTSLAAFFQWKSNLEVENKRLEGQLALEEKRFRYELLLRATEPESEQDRRALLKFYHEAGLVDGLEKLIEKYAEEESGFIPRSSGTSGGPVFDSPLNRFLEIASTRDGRRPTVDQGVKEAVRLALLGQSKILHGHACYWLKQAILRALLWRYHLIFIRVPVVTKRNLKRLPKHYSKLVSG